jgi:hypothetical protein
MTKPKHPNGETVGTFTSTLAGNEIEYFICGHCLSGDHSSCTGLAWDRSYGERHLDSCECDSPKDGYKVKTMEALSKNLQDPINQWPKDLQEAFIAKWVAFWSVPDAEQMYDCADTERACRVGNEAEEAAFKAAEAKGCCGSHDEDWEFTLANGKVTVRYGFNYGH